MPGGAAEGVPVKSKLASNRRSARNTGILKSDLLRSSVIVLRTADPAAGKTTYAFWVLAAGRGESLYGTIRLGPRKICRPPLYPLIWRTTSTARLVRSSMRPRTNSPGIVMEIAKRQTTMSLTPIERGLIAGSGIEMLATGNSSQHFTFVKVLCN